MTDKVYNLIRSKHHSNLILLSQLLAPVISGFTIYLLFSELSVPFRITIPTSVLVSVLIFGLANHYRTYSNNKDNRRSFFTEVSRERIRSILNIVFIIMYSASIISFLLVSPSTEIFTHWEDVNLLQLITLSAVIIVSVFAPGYAIISTMDRKYELGSLPRFLISYILSILLVGLFGYVLSSHGIPLSDIRTAFFGVNLLILSQFVIVKIIDRNFSRTFYVPEVRHIYELVKENISNVLVFGSLCGIVIVFTYILYYGTIIGDQWIHYGRTFMFLSGTYMDITISGFDIAYPPFFHSYLATFFGLSNMPSINSYVSINFTNFVPVIAFYYFFSKWISHHRKAALLATSLFTLSSGFGWVYALNLAATFTDNLEPGAALETLRQASEKTYDIFLANNFVNAAHPDITTGLIIIALPAGFVLLGMLKENFTNKLKYTVLTAAICLVGILTHDEFILFILIVSLVLIIFRLNYNPGYIFAGILLALSLVIVISISLPGAALYYMFSRIENLRPLIPVSFFFVFAVWAFYGLISKMRMNQSFVSIFRKTVSVRAKFLFAVAVVSVVSYFYILSFLIWDLQIPLFDVSSDTSNLRFVPWYFYPLRFGITGLLALSFLLSYIFRKYEREVLIFGIIAIIAFITGTYYSEFRFNKYIITGIAGFSSLMLFQVISLTRKKSGDLKYVVTSSLLIGSVIISGSLSVLMYAGYSALIVDNPDPRNEELGGSRVFPPDSEIQLMEFLRNNLNIKTDNVAIPERELMLSRGFLGTKIEGFAGQLPAKLYQTPLMLQEPSLGGLYTHMNYSNTKFVILPKDYINNTNFMSDVLKFVLKHFKTAYEDSNYVVLSVPPVAPPAARNEVALLSPLSPGNYYRYVLSALALSKSSYDIYGLEDHSALSKKMVILTSDPSNITGYLDYVKNGGTVLVFDTDTDLEGGFSNLLCIKPGEEEPFDRIVSIDGEILNASGVTRDFESLCLGSDVKSFYQKSGRKVAPFVTEAGYGKGKIVLVNAYGYFTAVSEHPKQLFSSLNSMPELVGLETEKLSSISAPNAAPYPYFFGDLNIPGPVTIESSSMLLPRPYSLMYADSVSLENQNQESTVYKPFSNILYVKNLELRGDYNVTISSPNLLYTPSLPIYSNYIPFDLPAGSSMTIKLSNGSKAKFDVLPENEPVEIDGGEIKFTNIRSSLLPREDLPSSVSVLLKAPELTMHESGTYLGLVRLNDPDNPTKFIPPWNDIVPNSLEVNGESVMKLDHIAISNGEFTNGVYVTYFKWIEIDTHINQPQAAPTASPLEVPLLVILTSDVNVRLIITVLIAASAVVYIGLSSPKLNCKRCVS